MTVEIAKVHEALASRLTRRGYAHSVAVAEMAAEIAREYGVDSDDAYLAGLLHDWARNDDEQTLRADARRFGIPLTSVDDAVPYLLHGRTGAAQLKERFPDLAECIVRAVERHTFGAAGMSDLEKVVYLADTLEPGRKNGAAEELRAQIGRLGLAELYERAYVASLEHLIRERRRIHPATVDAWNDIVAERG